MRLRQVRFTVGRMMIAVAVVAAGMGLLARRVKFLRMAAEHDKLIQAALHGPYLPCNFAQGIVRHRYLKERYERAARYPWLPVSSDSSPPRTDDIEPISTEAPLISTAAIPDLPPEPSGSLFDRKFDPIEPK